MLGTRFPIGSRLPGPGSPVRASRNSRDGSPRAQTTRSGPLVDIRHSDEIFEKATSHEDAAFPVDDRRPVAPTDSIDRVGPRSRLGGSPFGARADAGSRCKTRRPAHFLVRPPDGAMAYEQGVFGKRAALPGLSIVLPDRR